MVTGATLAAARAVWTSAAQHGASLAGGLHHAMARNASGFCIYNDPAVAIAWLLDQGAERIAYVDVDAHHGDGVQAAFWDDPRVLTISLHEHPETLFPGTGRPRETGGPHTPTGRRSTWPCRPAPGTPAGCGPSTPWCRRSCGRSGRNCWSASTAATRTGTTRWLT
jgi:acetoin utilization protein AcuC